MKADMNGVLASLLLAGTLISVPIETMAGPGGVAEIVTGADESVALQQALQAGRLRDFSEMAQRLRPLAAQGNSEACFRLAGLYRSGRGVSGDANLAAHWALKAAQQGHAGAKSLLASLCQRGKACSDNVNALLEQAARDGFQPARERLKVLRKSSNSGVDNDDLLSLIQRGHLRPFQAMAQSNKEQLRTALLIQDPQGRTPLMLAIENEHAELASWLLENFSGEALQLTAADQQQDSALTLALMQNLPLASDLVPALIKAGAEVNHANQQGDTPLLLALGLASRMSKEEPDQHGQVQALVALLEHLLKAGTDPNQTNHKQQSPLLLAERVGLTEPLAQAFKHKLLTAGAMPQPTPGKPVANMLAKDEQGLYEGWPALTVAAWQGEEARINTLLRQGVNLNATGPDGLTALARAAWRGHIRIVEALVRQGADILIQDKRGRNALMWALQASRPELSLSALLTARQASRALQQTEQSGQTVLLLAMEHSNLPVIRTLMTAGANHQKANSRGQTPLLLAVHYQRAEVVPYLLKQGANSAHQDKNGRNALWYAADGFVVDAQPGSRTAAVSEHVMIAGKILAQILRARNETLQVADFQGNRAVERCVIRHSMTCLTLLARHGGEQILPDHPSIGGNTLLMLASRSGQVQLVRHVLGMAPDLDLRNQEGNSALMLAAQKGHADVVERLLKAGANPFPRNRQKLDAAGMAEQGGHPKVAGYIRQASGNQNPLWKILGG
jgi:ankyrin repeat protein